MGFIQNLFSGGASQVIDSVGNVLDKVVTTKSEKLQLELELKKADHQFELDTQNLALEDKKAILGDIDSARKRDSEVQASANASNLSKNVSPILALGGTLLTFGLFGWLMFGKWDDTDQNKKEIILYVLGVLSGILTQVFSYYFGSSLGSKAKTDIIQNMNENMAAK
ncbi:MAG TPA: hypothetical protein VL443_14570 [Cyclobacteriaceae bacterium]|jgi:hypothetical protein|nr:hypothetical protein [Cyclobacteriaceae bacterium]